MWCLIGEGGDTKEDDPGRGVIKVTATIKTNQHAIDSDLASEPYGAIKASISGSKCAVSLLHSNDAFE